MPTIGDYALHAIEMGRFGLDGGAMFGIVPKTLWEKKTQPDAENRIPLHMRCLLLDGTDRLILIDAGIGDKLSEKERRIYAVDHSRHSLASSFEAAGFAFEDVTDVILTHLHFDHCGGATRQAEDGNLAVTFPSARYYVQRRHWEWARAGNAKEAASFLEKNIEPLAASGRLDLVDGKTEIFPGVTVLPVSGHTEAQQMVKVSGPEGTLVYVADLIPTLAHLKPAWVMAYDVDPLATIEEKEAFLEEAEREGWHLFFEHDPEVAVASLERTDGGIGATHLRALDEF